MKPIFIIIIIIIIYYLFFNECGCTENFEVDLHTFKKLIFGKKLKKHENKIKIKNCCNIPSHKEQLQELLKKKDNTPIKLYDTEFHNVMKSFTQLFSIFPQNSLLDKNGRLEITKTLLSCIPMKIELTNNYNKIVNTSDIINYDIIRPEENRAIIFNKHYNLTKISWERSLLNWYGQPINLELRLSFTNHDTGLSIYIIFPLIFIKDVQIENFQDDYYNSNNKFQTSYSRKKELVSSSMKSGIMYPKFEEKNILPHNLNFGILPNQLDDSKLTKNVVLKNMTLSNIKSESLYKDYKSILPGINLDKLDLSDIQNNFDFSYIKDYLNKINFNNLVESINNIKYTIKEASSIIGLDYLIVEPSIIPTYICCSPESVSIDYINTNLKDLESKILNQNKFYCTQSLDKSITYITQPYPYNQIMGNKIYNSLTSTLKLF